MRVCVKNFFFPQCCYMSSDYSQPPLVTAKVRCANLTWCTELWPGKWSAQHRFCGSLRRLQIPIPPFLLLTHLHCQRAAYSNTYVFINLYSLQACSLSKDPRGAVWEHPDPLLIAHQSKSASVHTHGSEVIAPAYFPCMHFFSDLRFL